MQPRWPGSAPAAVGAAAWPGRRGRGRACPATRWPRDGWPGRARGATTPPRGRRRGRRRGPTTRGSGRRTTPLPSARAALPPRRRPRPPPSASAHGRRGDPPSRWCRRSRAHRRSPSRRRPHGRRGGQRREAASPERRPRALPRGRAAAVTTPGAWPIVAPKGLNGSSGRSRLSSRSGTQLASKCSGSRPSWVRARPTTKSAIRPARSRHVVRPVTSATASIDSTACMFALRPR